MRGRPCVQSTQQSACRGAFSTWPPPLQLLPAPCLPSLAAPPAARLPAPRRGSHSCAAGRCEPRWTSVRETRRTQRPQLRAASQPRRACCQVRWSCMEASWKARAPPRRSWRSCQPLELHPCTALLLPKKAEVLPPTHMLLHQVLWTALPCGLWHSRSFWRLGRKQAGGRRQACVSCWRYPHPAQPRMRRRTCGASWLRFHLAAHCADADESVR